MRIYYGTIILDESLFSNRYYVLGFDYEREKAFITSLNTGSIHRTLSLHMGDENSEDFDEEVFDDLDKSYVELSEICNCFSRPIKLFKFSNGVFNPITILDDVVKKARISKGLVDKDN